jgi:hypothetical protein
MPRAEIDEAKVTRLMELRERNIEALIASETVVGIYIPGVSPKLKGPDRKAERALKAELTIPEIVEFDRRCRAKARAFWEAGDEERKWQWGGW